MTNEELDEALRPLRELLDGRETFSLERRGGFTTKQNNHMEVNIMASIDFENILKKVKDAAGNVADLTVKTAKTVADKSAGAAKTVAGKAQDTAKRTKLSAQIASEREGLKKKYLELGKLYYEKYAGNTDPDFAGTVEGIEAGLESIAAKQAQIEAMAAAEEEPAEPEEAAEDAQIPEEDHVKDEIEMTVEAEVEAAEVQAEEAAEEAAKTYEEAVPTVNKPEE